MADKQSQLNGAYYGPAIPPSELPRHHHRGRSCCCCLFSFFWKLLLAIIVFLVVVFLVFWAVVQPRAFKLQVTDAKLTQFNLTTTTTNNNNNINMLHYNLILNLTARNPNKKLNIYYDQVEGHVSYESTRFASTDLITWRNSFRQYTKSTDNMSGVFTGQHVMVFDRDHVKDFEKDERGGVFDIDVRLYLNIRFRLGDFIGSGSRVRAKCELQVPLVSRGVFLPTRCHVKF